MFGTSEKSAGDCDGMGFSERMLASYDSAWSGFEVRNGGISTLTTHAVSDTHRDTWSGGGGGGGATPAARMKGDPPSLLAATTPVVSQAHAAATATAAFLSPSPSPSPPPSRALADAPCMHACMPPPPPPMPPPNRHHRRHRPSPPPPLRSQERLAAGQQPPITMKWTNFTFLIAANAIYLTVT